MYVGKLLESFIPLIDNMAYKPQPKIDDTSLLSTSPEEIQENLKRWKEYNERIHIVV